ncbi:unnamed protein product, partial [Mycena citricolor]
APGGLIPRWLAERSLPARIALVCLLYWLRGAADLTLACTGCDQLHRLVLHLSLAGTRCETAAKLRCVDGSFSLGWRSICLIAPCRAARAWSCLGPGERPDFVSARHC